MPSLSAFLIVLNEEKNIERCLRSLAFADEIVVLDGGSLDRTVEIAGRFTQKIYSRPFDDFASQKNAALEKATGEWALSVDADEEVTPELAREIRQAVEQHPRQNAFRVRRKTRLFGRDMRFSGLQNDRPVRLFRRRSARFKNPVHEELLVAGEAGSLKSELRHFSFQTVGEHLKRLQLYTSLEPDPGAGRATRPGFSHFFLRPLRRFLVLYFLKRGFLDGPEGWVYCVSSAYYEFVRWAKCWEKHEKLG